MINIHEGSWMTVESHVSNELNGLTKRLESKDMDERNTQFVRGQISALRGLLRLENKPVVELIEIEEY